MSHFLLAYSKTHCLWLIPFLILQLRLYGKAGYWFQHKDLDPTISMPKEFSRAHSASKCWWGFQSCSEWWFILLLLDIGSLRRLALTSTSQIMVWGRWIRKFFVHKCSQRSSCWWMCPLKVYTVNRDGSEQTAFGYLGSNEGQILKPAGILLDDRYVAHLFRVDLLHNCILQRQCDGQWQQELPIASVLRCEGVRQGGRQLHLQTFRSRQVTFQPF